MASISGQEIIAKLGQAYREANGDARPVLWFLKAAKSVDKKTKKAERELVEQKLSIARGACPEAKCVSEWIEKNGTDALLAMWPHP